MNIKAAEELNANESNKRNHLKEAFSPRIATPSSLYPPGIAMMAENATPAMIVATTKLMLIMLLMSSCEKMTPFLTGCSSASISVLLEAFTFVPVLSFAFAGMSCFFRLYRINICKSMKTNVCLKILIVAFVFEDYFETLTVLAIKLVCLFSLT